MISQEVKEPAHFCSVCIWQDVKSVTCPFSISMDENPIPMGSSQSEKYLSAHLMNNVDAK